MSLSVRPSAPVAPRLHVAKARVPQATAPARAAARPVQPARVAQAEGAVATGGAIVGALGGGVVGAFGGLMAMVGLGMSGVALPLALGALVGSVLLGAGVGALGLGGAGKLAEWVAGKLSK